MAAGARNEGWEMDRLHSTPAAIDLEIRLLVPVDEDFLHREAERRGVPAAVVVGAPIRSTVNVTPAGVQPAA